MIVCTSPRFSFSQLDFARFRLQSLWVAMGALISSKKEENCLWFCYVYHREHRWRWGRQRWRHIELREDNSSTSDIIDWQVLETNDVWNGGVHSPDIMWQLKQYSAAFARRRHQVYHLLLIMGRKYPPHIIEHVGKYLFTKAM